MDPVQKALWFVESHSREPLQLEEIAKACNVSAFHVTRAFTATTGLSLMRYVRGRRLSEAAAELANGAEDILSVALDAGYGSHEAFTRAFRDLFGLTPEQVRAQGHLRNLTLVEAMTVKTAVHTTLAEPRFETLEAKLFAGLVERYDCQSPAGIPDQWQRFSAHLGNVPRQIGNVAYGLCYNFDIDSYFDYMAGMEVKDGSDLPKGFQTLQVPAGKYVVFSHKEHIAGIRSTLAAIWGKWIPESGLKPASAPVIERYGPEFNSQTGMGGLEIWIPLES
jgi:AraC family transcriptional regulator